MTGQTEAELIARTAARDDDALLALALKYDWLQHTVYAKFYLKRIGYDDWHQEVLWCCYQAAKTYQVGTGSFKSYYGAILSNCACSLMRYVAAKRRSPEEAPESYEDWMQDARSDRLPMAPLTIPYTILWRELLDRLNGSECAALLAYPGVMSVEEAAARYGYSVITLKGSRTRLRKALLEVLP